MSGVSQSATRNIEEKVKAGMRPLHYQIVVMRNVKTNRFYPTLYVLVPRETDNLEVGNSCRHCFRGQSKEGFETSVKASTWIREKKHFIYMGIVWGGTAQLKLFQVL